jgi:hypothetical protein
LALKKSGRKKTEENEEDKKRAFAEAGEEYAARSPHFKPASLSGF